MTDLFGREVAPASRSLVPAPKRVVPTIDISGRIGRALSKSVALQRFLESRLRARLSTDGSTLCLMTWKDTVTPAGRHVCRLRPSVRRTFGSGSGLLPTLTKVSAEHPGRQVVKVGQQDCVSAALSRRDTWLHGGQLNPSHAAWFMGYPESWISCGRLVTLLSRKSRQSS